MRSAAASGRLGFRFIILVVVLCICSAAGAVVSDQGQPPHSAKQKLVQEEEQLMARQEEQIRKDLQVMARQEEEIRKDLQLMARQEVEIRKTFQSIQENQQEFTAMQANISAPLENVLRMTILADSQTRFIRAFIFYCCAAFLIYMLTSANETFRIRGHLFLGLFATMMLEAGVPKLGASDDYGTLLSKVLQLRSVFFAAATVHFMQAFVTYKG